MRRPASAVVLIAFVACTAQDPPIAREPTRAEDPPHPWRPLFDGASIDGWQITSFGGEGEVGVVDGELLLDQGSPLTGVTWCGEFPTDDYEIRVTARRLAGSDFFCGLTFPVGDDHLTLVLGGWGGSLVGLSCLDDRDASENETTQYHRFDTGVPHRVQVRVTDGRVVVSLGHAVIMDVQTHGRALSLRPEVLLSRPLGIAAFATKAAIGEVAWRDL